MINLSNTTLVTIDGLGNEPNCIKALLYSCSLVKFGSVKYFSPINLSNKSDYEYIQIPKLSYADYSEFCISELPNHITTKYALIIHDDGFVINPTLWTDEFFKYDYIGAMWPLNHLYFNTRRWPAVHNKFLESGCSYLVGNGGFCLRSKKLMEEAKKLYTKDYYDIPEDAVIAIAFRKELENKELKFATNDIASKFSCETTNLHDRNIQPEETFGFHGRDTHSKYVSLLESIKL